ncbi:MAG: hypothetical protein V1772_03370, partial [Chloroflexota bacterium]
MQRAHHRKAASLGMEALNIQGGRSAPGAVHMRAVDSATMRAKANRGELYAIIEVPLGGAMPAGLYDELLTTLSHAYYDVSGSITRGLRDALLAANTLLFERNLRADSAHRVVAGLNCVVKRDEDVYVGQLGPALAIIVSQGALVRYPTDSAWLSSANPGALEMSREPPAGLRREAEPDLYHTSFMDGDVLVVAATALARAADADALVAAASEGTIAPVRDYVASLGQEQDLCAYIVGLAEPVVATAVAATAAA